MYYILTTLPENDNEDAILDGTSKYLDRIQCSFQEGLALPAEDIDVPISFHLNQTTLRGKMTDHLSIDDIPGPVFSSKTKALLKTAGITNIEYYQLTLEDEFLDSKEKDANFFSIRKTPAVDCNYFIANVVGLVDCVDHQKSKLEYFYPPELRNQQRNNSNMVPDEIDDPFAGENPNDIDFITKLVLNDNKINPVLKIFRLLDQPNLLIFHSTIVDIIKKARLSGFVFVPVTEYTEVIPNDDNDEAQDGKKVEPKKIPQDPKKSKFNFSLE